MKSGGGIYILAQSEEQRDTRLDFMRALGTLTIIVPHVLSPDFLIQVRTFDVVMLVFVSGMSYTYQAVNKRRIEYCQYVKKRCRRLLLPTLILIFSVFTSINVASVAFGKGMHYHMHDLLSSLFLFEEGIGYVWIIKVYLGLALIAPFSWEFIRKLKGNIQLLVMCGSIYIIYSLVRVIDQMIYLPILSVLLEEYIFYVVAYAIPFVIGMYLGKNKSRVRSLAFWSVLCFAFTQIFIIIQGGGFEPNLYKYPPELYYLSYGIVCSIIIYYIAPTKINSGIKWLSKNSLVFYLVHVFWVVWLTTMINSLKLTIIDVFWMKYILVVLLTTVTTLGINYSVRLFKEKNKREWEQV